MRLNIAACLAMVFMVHGVADARTVQYEINIDYGTVNFTGQEVTAIKLNNGIPAPTIEAQVGDMLEVTFHNHLDTESSIHWHGILLPNDQDGVPHLTTPPIPAGETFTFRFPVIHSGTYWYHSHTGLQEQRGVYGPIIFHPQQRNRSYDHEITLVWSDWIDENPDRVLANLKHDGDYYALKKDSVQSWQKVIQHGMPAIKQRVRGAWTRMGPMDISDIGFDAFLANGKRATRIPNIDPGQQVLVRMINAAASSYFNVEFAGGKMSVVAADGVDVEPFMIPRLRMAIAETYDVLLTVPESGEYELRATARDGSGYASAWLGTGQRVAASDIPRPNLFVMEHSGMDHSGMDHSGMDHSGMDHSGMDHSGMDHSGMDHSDMDNAHSAHAQAPPVAKSIPVRAMATMVEYEHLRATAPTDLDSRRPWRIVELDLTGNMERYVWSFNNKTLSEADRILIRKAENVRFILRNATMMHHPIHLHGHFFRVLNGQGDHAPLKHTVNVPPMATIEIEFAANEDRDWFFHCHNLYHMKTGMARVISYQDSSRYDKALRAKIAGDNRFYPSVEASLQTHMTAGEAMFANNRNAVELEYDYNYDGEYEAELVYRRYLNRFTSIYAGAELEREEAESGTARAIAGISYTLPLLIDADLEVDSDNDVRLRLGSSIQLTNRLNLQWQWNTDDEYRLTASYEITKQLSLVASHDDEFDAGVGAMFSWW